MRSTILACCHAFSCCVVLASSWAFAAEDAVRWRRDLEEAKQEAAASSRLVLLHFYGSACKPCTQLDRDVFSQAKAAEALEANYVPVKVNVDHSMAIASAYNVTNWPSDVILTPNGQVVAKFVSPQGLQPYLGRMSQVALAARQQAADGLVNMGAPGANPYAAIATSAGTATAQANTSVPPGNQNYAAPTQYQEPAGGHSVAGGMSPYDATGPLAAPNVYAPSTGGAPYANGQYGGANTPAPNQSASDNRYGNYLGDRYAPQVGQYSTQLPASTPNQQQTAVQGGFPASATPPNGVTDQYGAGVGRYYSAENAAGSEQTQAAAPQAHTQPNPYAVSPTNTGSSLGAPGAPVANGTATPNPYAAGPGGPQLSPSQPVGDRYAMPQNTVPPQYGAQQPYNAAPPAGATDYSQGPGLQAQAPPPMAGAVPQPGAPSSTAAEQSSAAPPVSGNPAFAFDGFCPVSLQERQRWVQGDKAWGAIHLGQTFLFVGQVEQQKFLANPDLYAPVLAGNDAVLLVEQNVHQLGSRAHGVTYRGRVYLFSNEESLSRFSKDPERYANGVRQAMMQPPAAAADQRR